jgi:hypothetical protein
VRLCSLALALAVVVLASARADSDWREQVSARPAGNFPALPGLKLHYSFGWSNVLRAAHADAWVLRQGPEYRVRITGGTEGLARALWPLDAQHSAMILVDPLQPERIAQLERYRKRTIETQAVFDGKGVKRLRKVTPSDAKPKWKRVEFEPMFDVLSGVLYVRSQPLNVGDRLGVVAFPGDSPYLATVRVVRREKIRCMGRDWPALRLSLEIRKLDVKIQRPTEALKYAKFQSGTVWVSDDDLRIPLRAEVRIFVGFVYGELTGCERL